MPIAASDLTESIGTALGPSGWHTVGQERVDSFAEATEDRQWIHVDAARAAETPFGGTVAHGYLTLALAPALLDEIVSVENTEMVINYGANKVRFPAPLRVGSRVRMSAEVASAETSKDGSVQVVFDLTFEADGTEKPCCVAEIIFRYYPQASAPAGSGEGRQVRPADAERPPPVTSTAVWPPVPDPAGMAAAWLRWLSGTYALGATSIERSSTAKPGDLDALFAPAAENAALAARFWADVLESARSRGHGAAGVDRTG